jgi:hypothetical protein
MEQQYTFYLPDCGGYYVFDDLKKNVTIYVQFPYIDSKEVAYIAAAPAHGNSSFSGSGLPYASPTMAIDGTPNKGKFVLDQLNRGQFTTTLPNSYYAALGTVLVPPTIYLNFILNGESKTVGIQVSEPVPFRTLTYDNLRTSAKFYDNIKDLPVRTQENVLRDSAYPKLILPKPQNFWGLKPSI